jgi:predicted phosphodiesterase
MSAKKASGKTTPVEKTKDSLTQKLVDLVSPGPMGSDRKLTKTPESWTPNLELTPEGGILTSNAKPVNNMPEARDLLIEFGLNPDEWHVTNLGMSRWQRYDGELLESKRLKLVPLELLAEDKADVEAICKEVSKWKPQKPTESITGPLAYLVVVSDQQIGKKVGDSGTEDIVQRILDTTSEAVQRLKDLRKIGRAIGTIVLALPGDHVEGNVSQNGRLQGQAASDLGITEQVRVARRVLLAQIKAFAPLCEELIVPVVNGNHDESTRQVTADPADGWNTEVASAVQDICAEVESLSHVKFRYPAKGNQNLSININGVMLGLFHGHQMGGVNPIKYLEGQSLGMTDLGQCDVWVSGHFHHYRAMDIGQRFWVQAPTLDGGSNWFRDKKGLDSHPGLLTMVIGENHDPRKDLSIIRTYRV